MGVRTHLLARLDAIGLALQHRNDALALLGLGSVGLETARIDAFSDLDFFAIVRQGAKAGYLADLGWLAEAQPLVYQFRNTVDGYKVLYADGIFAEFAVFEPAELAAIPFAPGRLVWQHADFDPQLVAPTAPRQHQPPSAEWCIGEALTNLYVGLGRFRRGEKLSAARLIQQHAIDRLLELLALEPASGQVLADPFTIERRVEARYPAFAPLLASFVQGYERSPESALAILAFLEQRAPINPAMAAAIRQLAEPPVV